MTGTTAQSQQFIYAHSLFPASEIWWAIGAKWLQEMPEFNAAVA
jgi:hypothetical protein